MSTDETETTSEISYVESSLSETIPRQLKGLELEAGGSAECSLVLHADHVGDCELCLLFVFRNSVRISVLILMAKLN